MEKKESNKRKSLFTKLALVAALIIGSSSVAVADELTVTSSTTKTYTSDTPIAGNLLGSTLIKSEFIIPASKLTELKGKDITKMSFTLNAATTGWGDAEFQVFLKEVSSTAYPSPVVLFGNEGATIVYEGQLDATKASIDINFTSAFNYSSDGNNLLVGVYCTKTGTAASVNFKLIRESTSDYTYYSGYTNNANGSLTRTNWYPETTFTYQDANISTPLLSVSSNSIAFGSCRSTDTKTVTVTNTGVGSMDVTISSDNTTDFTVSATSLTGIGAGESKTFDVTFNYDATSLGDKTANITVTPSYDAAEAKVIAVTATAADASVWEDFDNGIPSTWYNQDNSWLNYVPGLNGMASPDMKSNDVLRTPRLYAEENEVITFDVKIGGTTSSYKIKAEYSTDRIHWNTIDTYTESGNKSFMAPATGYYWLRFTGYKSGIDNFSGWKIADTTHETVLGTLKVPATGLSHDTYTASVDVMELGGSNETITAELYFNEVKVAEQTGIALSANYDLNINLSYEPIIEGTYNVYLRVFGDNIGSFVTDTKEVTISEPSIVLDENSSEHPNSTVSTVVKVKYTAKAGWNTIVMPFQLTDSDFKTIFGDDFEVYSISNYDNGKLTFKKTTSYLMSMPYLIYAPNAVENVDGIYLKNTAFYSYAWTWSNLVQTKGNITFKGTFAPIAAPGMEGKYGVTNKGTVAMGGSGASIKAYRAYLELAETAPARSLTLVIDGEGGTTTAIGELVRTLEGDNGKQVYNLSGQRVEKAKKGLYIVGGKKVIVK